MCVWGSVGVREGCEGVVVGKEVGCVFCGRGEDGGGEEGGWREGKEEEMEAGVKRGRRR